MDGASTRRRVSSALAAVRWATMLLILGISPVAAAPRAIYVVRHAEKLSDMGDPPLSPLGSQRAIALANALEQAEITAIFTSDAARTKLTAQPLAARRLIEPVIVPGGDPAVIAQRIQDDLTSGAVLVVGHSNTVPELIKRLAPNAQVTITDHQFDRLFVLIPGAPAAAWAEFRYGATSANPPAAQPEPPAGLANAATMAPHASDAARLDPGLRSVAAPAGRYADFDPHHPPPTGEANLFQLSQDYPTTYRADIKFPWEPIDFRSHPELYLRTVLAYCLEGNVEVDFRVQNNLVRTWYHAPWLHDDGELNGAGREYHHGLTRERRSRPLELHEQQTDFAQNWAVGMVNDRGGYALGKVWRTADGEPDPSSATFPDQTVSFKLLFTDASDGQVPFLKNSKSWQANIYQDTNYQSPRIDRDVRLLQIDVAVKEPRVASQSGWIFGTFIYDGAAPFTSVWDRMAFVGVSWGDDSDVRTDMNRDGAFENGELRSTAINSELIEPGRGAAAQMRHLGLGGRLNGPVDSPVSSCLSCHGRAATFTPALPLSASSGKPLEFVVPGVRKPSEFPPDAFERFFRAVRPNSQLVSDNGELYVSTDYSLQVSAGIRNFYQALRSNPPAVERLLSRGRSRLTPAMLKELPALRKVTRGDEN